MAFQIFWTAANAVLPIILLIVFGHWLRHHEWVSEDFLKRSNKLVFRFFLPCMLFLNVYAIDSLSSIHWEIVLYSEIVLLLLFVCGLVTAVCTSAVPERRGVILQCVFRSNFAIIGLPLAGALGGEDAMAVAAVLSAFTIPTINILGVIALSLFVKGKNGEQKSIGTVLRDIAKNPLIWGVLCGLAALVLRGLQLRICGELVFSLKRDLSFLYTFLNHLKSITTPLALLVMGGRFQFSSVRALRKEIAVATVWRIILAPAFGIGGAVLLSGMGLLACGSAEYPALLALFGSPVAVASAIMAAGMGSDEQLATQLVVWTSIGSVATIFLCSCALMAYGLVAI